MTTTLHRSTASRQLDRTSVRRPRARRHHLLSKALVAVIACVQVYPLLWILLGSLRTQQDFASGNPFALPHAITLDNFARAFGQSDLPRYITNSLIVTVASNALIIGLGMMGAYAISVLGFRFSRAVPASFLVGIVVPVQVALLPLFINYSNLGLLNTYGSVILPLVGFALPISIYLFTSFYSYVPRDLYEAATLDGAGPYRIFARITAPLSINTVVTVFFVNSIFIWNDFVFANTFILSTPRKTVPLGLQDYIGAMGATDWTATFAAVCVTVTPLLLVFLALNKAIIYGLEGGGSKG